ncbi:MAG: Maf family protein [Succinivibrio sp.]|nr:Maf family protein [Succinivibrio sp.]
MNTPHNLPQRIPELILASGSPRRAHFMQLLNLPFTIQEPDVDESRLPGETPKDLVLRLSLLKASHVAAANPDKLVLAADTVVALGNQVFGKPKDRHDAFLMIKELQGKTHQVYTGVALRLGHTYRNFCECTYVTFAALTDDLIQAYVDTGESDDKSGSYAVQGTASLFVTKVEGSVSSVVGLPISQVREALSEFGLIPKTLKEADA